MGCCTRNGSSWITAIMVYTIVQSIVSVLWQIQQILLYECVLEYPQTESPVLGFIYFAYNLNPKCLINGITIEQLLASLNLQLTHESNWMQQRAWSTLDQFNESERVYYLAMIHLVFDIFWIFASIVALSVRSKKNSAYGVNIFWMCVAVLEFGIDITSVSFFAKDAITWQNDELYIKDLVSAAIIMAIVASRLVLPLLVNVCMFFRLISITKDLKKPPVQSVPQQQHHHNQGAYPPRRHTQARIVPLKPAMRAPRPPHLQEQNMSRVSNWYNHYDEPMPRSINSGRPREGPNELHQRRYESLQPQNLPMQHQNLPLRSQNMPLQSHNLPVQSPNMHFRPQNVPLPVQNVPLRPQNLPKINVNEVPDEEKTAYPNNWYNVYDSTQPTHLPRVKSGGRPQPHAEEEEEREEPLLEDDYPRRGRPDMESYEDAPSELSYSDHPNFVGDHTNVMVNGVPSGTLRRQLPWSYVHQPGMFPRKQTRDLSVEAPPVPVPDYTMRINMNHRPDLDSFSQGSHSSPGPAARFNNNRNPQAQ